MTIYSFSTGNVALGAGTYYLVLQQAGGSGNEFYWTSSGGLSTATSNAASGISSELFLVTGFVAATTPLPSTWVMLLSGLLGLGLFAYRGTKKSRAAIAAA